MTGRLPLRLRLTLVFAVAMAVVLAAVGTFLYVRVGDSLREQVDERLATQAETLAATVVGGDVEPTLPGGEDEFAQVLGRNGEVAAATPGYEEPLLAPEELTAAHDGRVRASLTVAPPGEDEREPARLLAVPAGPSTVVVGASLEDRADALDGLLAQLLVGGPIALLLAAGAGYVLAGAALRPVEDMRCRAGKISAETSGERLPLPAARDELHRLGATLNAMLDRLDAGLRRERRFVADASHELRTPLSLLRAELDLALRRPRTAEELGAALRSASEEVDRLTLLAEDLLLLAASENGDLPLRPGPVGVHELLDGVASRFSTRAEAAGRQLALGAAAGEVTADRLRLEQALGNLVDNALRHGDGRIVLEAFGTDGGTALRVRDEGPGFAPGFVGRAFERFSRDDDARTSAGAGLGLAIVEAVARAHGGEARARNRPEGGSEVTIVLPRPPPGPDAGVPAPMPRLTRR
jgi:signal transduction histidine kinase